jgi:hypothetical protein
MIRFSIIRLLCTGFFLSGISYASEKPSIRIDNIDVFARTKLFKQVCNMAEYNSAIDKDSSHSNDARAKCEGQVDFHFKYHDAKKADVRGQLITNSAGYFSELPVYLCFVPQQFPFLPLLSL